MEDMSVILKKNGWTVRSGGAKGADTAFEVRTVPQAQIFLPKPGFNGRKVDNETYFYLNNPEAEKLAASFHPAWHNCDEYARQFHTRNVFQILGMDLISPSKFVICWTKDGEASGGTGQAMRIAKFHEIPIFNLRKMNKFDIGIQIQKIEERLK